MEESTLAKIATEALKPVSSVIDVLLEPTLQRIRSRATKKELVKRLEDPIINGLLDQYFKRLLRRVSGITTIVFPQQAIPLTSIYEPLYLTPRYQLMVSAMKSALISPDEDQRVFFSAAKDIEFGKNYLIVDSAGMGKSTFAKHLVLDVFKSTIKIPIFLELRKIDDSETLMGRLAKEIDEDQDDIDEKFLRVLLAQGNYVIILDGYDELSENARKRIGPQITNLALRSDQNTLVLTSRPEVDLPEVANSAVYSIETLTRSQAASLVLRYDAFANLTVGKGLIEHFDSISDDLLETPLLIVLLYRTYGYNQSISTKITSFYDDVYNAFYKGHDLTKSGFSRAKLSELDSENFRRLLQAFSFLLLIEGKTNLKSRAEGYTVIEKAAKVTSITPSSTEAFFDDLLTSVPFLVRDGNEFHFIHKSLGEFFAAEYLAFAPDAEKIIKIIRENIFSYRFRTLANLLAEIHPSLFRRSILAPFAREFLAKQDLIPEPHIRLLYLMGVSHVAFAKGTHEDLMSFVKNRRKNARVSLSIMRSPLNTKYSMGLIGDELFNARLPIELLKALSSQEYKIDETDFDDAILKKDIKKFLKLKGISSIESKNLLRLCKNQLFDRFLRNLTIAYTNLSAEGIYDVCRLIDDEACEKALEKMREERKAQKQIDTILSSH